MNDFFRRLPLMAKLLLMAVVPLLFIGYLTIDLYKEKSYNVDLAESYHTRIDQSINLTRLAGELQKERRYSFVYTLDKASQKEMLAQRPSTDNVLHKLKSEHDESLKDFPEYTYLGQLDSVRKMIDSGKYSKEQVMHFYSSSIFRLNTLNKAPTLVNQSLISTNNDLTTQRLLSELITYQSIVDANVFNILFTKQYVIETLFGTYPTWDVYKTYEKEFKVKATTDALKRYETFQSRGALHDADAYLDKLFSTFKLDSSLTYQSWATIADNSLKELHTYQEQVINKVQSDINDYYQKEVLAKSQTIFYLVGITVLLIALLTYILHVINSSLNQLKRAAIQLSKGETDIHLQPQSADAIGSLTTSIQQIAEHDRALALAARGIGNGNFQTELTPRSERDLLGNAIAKMQERLLDYTNDLKNAKEEFEKLADFMPQIVWTADEFGRTNYYNKKWYEVTKAGKGNNEQVWVQVTHPDDAGHILSAWYKSIDSGEPFEKEYRLRDVQSNSYRWFLGRAVPVVNDANEIVKWFGTATDIHDQKLQEEKLEELVKQRTVELNRSNEDLQQFAHVASHDLKEPLRKIITFSERLAAECNEGLPDTGKFYLNKLQSSSLRMSNMIDSILKYSVVNATDTSFETINLNAVINGIKNDLELMILQKKAQINYGELPQLKGAPTLIYQLFYNLINNALKFSKKDTASMINITATKVSSSEVTGLSDIKKANEYYHIILDDNGIGFEQEYADAMFNVFTRLNSRNAYEGTGLGLALCKKIVLRHSGAIYAKGTEGVGAAFHIILPAN